MKILVIGNGFDLAHGLPTKYTDFMEFINVIKQVLNKGEIEWGSLHSQVRKEIQNNMGNVPNNIYTQENMWNDLIGNNFWIEYFLQCDRFQKENWIDFESEISDVIKSLDMDMKNQAAILEDSVDQCSNDFLDERFCSFLDEINPTQYTYKMIRDILLNDLKKLIRVLEIYLTDYVEKIDCNTISLDIPQTLPIESVKINEMPVYDIIHVLSFNYTDTYRRLYIDKKTAGDYFEKYIDYIHGKAKENSSIDLNNMVLGIDEYLSKERKDQDIEFIAFKKYYQRIHKGTGCKYKEWVEEIREDWEKRSKGAKSRIRKCISKSLPNDKIHRLYIFGHSLDITDKDILRDLILNDNVHTTIYYPDREELGRKIANLVKVIGQDELIRRTGGTTRTIRFELQQEMKQID